MSMDQRQSPRKVMRSRGMLMPEGAAPISIYTVDIAPGGLCVTLPVQLMERQRCKLSFDVLLNGKKYPVAAVARTVYCVLTRNDGFRAGLQFTEVNAAGTAAIEELFKN